MSNVDKAKAEAAKNYSAEQVAAIVAASPLNLESAKALGKEIGKEYRSVIAKCLSLQAAGIAVEYISKPPPAKRQAVETKAEIVAAISTRLAVPLSGLEKATVKALIDLRQALATPDKPETVSSD